MRSLVILVVGFAVSLASVAPAQETGPADRAIKNPTVEDLPLLFKTVQDETHCFPKRTAAARAVARLGEDAVPSVLAKVKQLRRSSWTSQVNYLYFLVLMGPDARSAEPTLEEFIAEPGCHKYLRHYAETAQAAIHEDLGELRRLATRTIDYGDVALQVLEEMGPEARAAAPDIARLVRLKHPRTQRMIQALELIDSRLAEEVAAEIIHQ